MPNIYTSTLHFLIVYPYLKIFFLLRLDMFFSYRKNIQGMEVNKMAFTENTFTLYQYLMLQTCMLFLLHTGGIELFFGMFGEDEMRDKKNTK